MIHYSNISILAFLALMCMADSNCSPTSTLALSSDRVTAEEIWRESAEHGASVTLLSGKTITCCCVAIRKDSTRWRPSKDGSEVSVPSDSVASIRVANAAMPLQTFLDVLEWGFLGALSGVLVAGILGGSDPCATVWTTMIVGFLVGGAIGGQTGASNETIWTRELGEVTRGGGSLTRNPHSVKWDADHERWIYPPNDTLYSRDTTQTKQPH
jgi:hypothetical protein